MSSLDDILGAGLDILKATVTGQTSSAQIGDLTKANAVAVAVYETIGVKPDIRTDSDGKGGQIFTLYFSDTTSAANALVATIDHWRGKFASDEASAVRYDFSSALVPALIRSFFFPVALAGSAFFGLGYLFGKAK